MSKFITGEQFKKMIINGADQLVGEYEYINELNVFPVPDGDTGTNMKITISSAIDEIKIFDGNDISILGRGFSRALLMNARGNSGVIFSQIIKGFISSFKEGQKSLTVEDLICSFKGAKEIAYNAVANPVEGTILTVIRCVSEALIVKKDFEDIEDCFKFAVETAKVALDNTPNLLEELKRVGVVDSGGYGLWCFLVGMYDCLIGKVCAPKNIDLSDNKGDTRPKIQLEFDEHDNEEGFGYCSEIIMKIGAQIDPQEKPKKPFDLERFKASLLKIGDSLVCVQDEDLVKVHVHTFTPGTFLNLAQPYGEFLKIKFENMTEQYYQRIEKQGIKIIDTKKPNAQQVVFKDEQGITMTCPSKKIKAFLKSEYGINNVLDTSNIGNPSIQDILLLIQDTKCNKVFVITDDSNIYLAASQAADIVKSSIDVRIIKGTNIFEGLISALEFNPLVSMDANERQMKHALANCKSAVISTSIKDVDYTYIQIKKEDYITIIGKKILFADKDELTTLKATVDLLIKQSSTPDILVIIYGSKKDLPVLKLLEEYVEEHYHLICEFKLGGQKIYNYFIGIQ